MASIGPINVNFIQSLAWSNSAIVQDVPIPFGQSFSYKYGAAQPSYTLRSSFHALTDWDAGLIRAQLNELVGNPDIAAYYIDFDRDEDELNGWYLLRDLNTDYPPSSLGNYPFTVSATRVGETTAGLGIYWKSDLITNYWNISALARVILPNGVNTSSADNDPLEGEDGLVYYSASPNDSLLILDDAQDKTVQSNLEYTNTCHVFYSVGATKDHPTQDRVTVYSPQSYRVQPTQPTITDSTNTEKYPTISNGIVRMRGRVIEIYNNRLGLWHNIAGFYPRVVSNETTELTVLLTKVSADEIKWKMIFTEDPTKGERVVFNCRLGRGRPYIEFSFVPGTVGGMEAGTYLSPMTILNFQGNFFTGNNFSLVSNLTTTGAPSGSFPVSPTYNVAVAIKEHLKDITGWILTEQPPGNQPPVSSSTQLMLPGDFPGTSTPTEHRFAILAAMSDDAMDEVEELDLDSFTLGNGAILTNGMIELDPNTSAYAEYNTSLSWAAGDWFIFVEIHHIENGGDLQLINLPENSPKTISHISSERRVLTDDWTVGIAANGTPRFNASNADNADSRIYIRKVVRCRPGATQTSLSGDLIADINRYGRDFVTNVRQKIVIVDPNYVRSA